MLPELPEHFFRNGSDFNGGGRSHGVHKEPPVGLAVLGKTTLFKEGFGLHGSIIPAKCLTCHQAAVKRQVLTS